MDIAELDIIASTDVQTASRRLSDSPVVLDARVVTGSGGGPDKTILNSPRFLRSRGYRMLCAYMHPPKDSGYAVIESQAAELNAPLISIPDRGPLDWKGIARLLQVCRREHVKIWHGHDYKSNALGLLLKQFWPMRLVTTVHGWVHHSARTPLYYKLDRLCLPRYERVLCVSEDLLQSCLQAGVPASKCMLLENGIDPNQYCRSRTTAEAKSRLKLPEEGLLVGAVGRLETEKGFDTLIRSVHAIHEAGLDVRLMIVGEGSERSRLERLAAELKFSSRLVLTGWQTDVREYFEAMDVFALSSYREGLPNVVLEAMALEVPVVATRVNGVPRLIEDGRSGLLVDPGDIEALTMALTGLLKNQAIREVFSKGARLKVETTYSFATRIDRLKRIYDELLAC